MRHRFLQLPGAADRRSLGRRSAVSRDLSVVRLTMTPGVPPTDSGELALAAWTGGVAHAPGFPLYTALGWLWSHVLPVGQVAWRLNLLSALCAALAAGLTYVLILRTWRGPGDRQASPLLAAAVGTLAWGLGRTVWGWATIAEVYALNLMLTAAILWLVVRWTGLPAPPQASAPTVPASPVKRKPPSVKRPAKARLKSPGRAARPSVTPAPGPASDCRRLSFRPGPGQPPHLHRAAGAGHRVLADGPAGLAGLDQQRRHLRGAGAVAGAAIYLYLPLRAAADPLLNWGQPDTWQRFWWHVTAKQYRVSLLSAPVWPQVKLAAELWWTQFTPLGLALLLLGAWRMAQSQRALVLDAGC